MVFVPSNPASLLMLAHIVGRQLCFKLTSPNKKIPLNMSGSFSQDHTSLLSLAKTSSNIQNLKRELVGYDHLKGSEILNGFIYGFYPHYTGARMPRDAKNLKSARSRPDIVGQNIHVEIETGRVAGPFAKSTCFPPGFGLGLSV